VGVTGDMALICVFLGHVALSCEVARAATVEVGRVRGGSGSRWHRQAQHRWWWR
jgi:hypothetical protein